jgi:hypothetical protein
VRPIAWRDADPEQAATIDLWKVKVDEDLWVRTRQDALDQSLQGPFALLETHRHPVWPNANEDGSADGGGHGRDGLHDLARIRKCALEFQRRGLSRAYEAMKFGDHVEQCINARKCAQMRAFFRAKFTGSAAENPRWLSSLVTWFGLNHVREIALSGPRPCQRFGLCIPFGDSASDR